MFDICYCPEVRTLLDVKYTAEVTTEGLRTQLLLLLPTLVARWCTDVKSQPAGCVPA